MCGDFRTEANEGEGGLDAKMVESERRRREGDNLDFKSRQLIKKKKLLGSPFLGTFPREKSIHMDIKLHL